VVLYQERYNGMHKELFAKLKLSSTNIPTLVLNFVLFIPLMTNLVLAINKHPDAQKLFSRTFIIAIVFYDTKSAIDKTFKMRRSLFIFNFVALGLTCGLLILPPIAPEYSMIFVGCAISLVFLVEGVDVVHKYGLLKNVWEKLLFFLTILCILMSVSLSIVAGFIPVWENVFTVAATITAIGYSSASCWLNQIAHQYEQAQVVEFNSRPQTREDSDIESDLVSDIISEDNY